MSAAVLLEIIGGVRAAIFAGFALALAVLSGVQTMRLHSARTAVAELKAENAAFDSAQSANLSAIDALKKRIEDMVKEREVEQKRSALAVAAVMIEMQNAQLTADKRKRELESIYARNPNAAAWAAAGVDADVLRQLPGNQD